VDRYFKFAGRRDADLPNHDFRATPAFGVLNDRDYRFAKIVFSLQQSLDGYVDHMKRALNRSDWTKRCLG